jgi:hypothetical protein
MGVRILIPYDIITTNTRAENIKSQLKQSICDLFLMPMMEREDISPKLKTPSVEKEFRNQEVTYASPEEFFSTCWTKPA